MNCILRTPLLLPTAQYGADSPGATGSVASSRSTWRIRIFSEVLLEIMTDGMIRKHVVGAASSPSGEGSASRVTAKTQPPEGVRRRPWATLDATGTGKAHEESTCPQLPRPKSIVDMFVLLLRVLVLNIEGSNPRAVAFDVGETFEPMVPWLLVTTECQLFLLAPSSAGGLSGAAPPRSRPAPLCVALAEAASEDDDVEGRWRSCKAIHAFASACVERDQGNSSK
mmetsp:Transcript_140674/g.366271  ORF Transcript_140674/g.366271 Transcript_140674/m.366271 type:complete len:225 (+) Transcript_140674:760-1434(+)